MEAGNFGNSGGGGSNGYCSLPAWCKFAATAPQQPQNQMTNSPYTVPVANKQQCGIRKFWNPEGEV